MTPEAQRIAIAEACPTALRQVHGRWQYSDGTHWWNCKDNDPLSDLNAMHEAEKVLTDLQQMLMRSWLEEIVERPGKIPSGVNYNLVKQRIWTATAAQRYEAFLRTLNLWTD